MVNDFWRQSWQVSSLDCSRSGFSFSQLGGGRWVSMTKKASTIVSKRLWVKRWPRAASPRVKSWAISTLWPRCGTLGKTKTRPWPSKKYFCGKRRIFSLVLDPLFNLSISFSLRIPLTHESPEVRAAALRTVRCILRSESDVNDLQKVNMHLLITRFDLVKHQFLFNCLTPFSR